MVLIFFPQKIEEDKRIREDEIKRREAERKKRHEELARGDGKKSFFELQQTDTYPSNNKKSSARDDDDSEKEEGEIETTIDIPHSSKKDDHKKPSTGVNRHRTKSGGSIDMNALDYEDHQKSDNDDRNDIDFESSIGKKKSDVMALAMGVEPKTFDKDELKEHSKSMDKIDQSRCDKDRDDDKKKSERRKSRDKDVSRSRSRERRFNKRSPLPFYRNNNNNSNFGRQQPYRGRFNNSPRRRDFRGGRFDRRRRSRSWGRRPMRRSPVRRRSRDRRDNRRRSRSRSRDHHRDDKSSRSRSHSRSRSLSKSHSRGSRGRRSRTNDGKQDLSRKSISKEKAGTSIPPILPIKTLDVTEDEKARIQREKMLKRAETLLLLKSHMEKEIEEQQRRQKEKKLQVIANTNLFQQNTK